MCVRCISVPTAESAKRLAMKAVGLLALASTVAAIYPDDHWTYSTKLTSDNFEAKVKAEVDAGRTLFVRWIASAG